MLHFVVVVLSSCVVSSVRGDYSFLSIGDWGGAALGGQDLKNVNAVANEMVQVATTNDAHFVINTGDNFYWCGIQNSSDYQIRVDYEEPYADASLQVPWYSALGNHEYGYNVDAQIEYMQLSKTWYLPSRYYSKRILLDATSSTYLSLVVLDTSPCVSDYRNANPSYWDPCSTTYPTCSLQSTDDDFEGPCAFHNNILSQDCQTQYTWLQSTLQAVPKDDWLIIVGHHPIDECDVLDLTSVIQQYPFALYLNGHSHTLAHYTIDSKGAYITTGAGSLVNTVDQTHPLTVRKVKGLNVTREDLESLGRLTTTSHTYQTVYNNKVAGFTAHTFDNAFSTLTTKFVSYTGSIIHSFTVDKSGNYIN